MTVTSWFLYIAFILYVDGSLTFNSVASMKVAFNSPVLYLVLILTVGIAFCIDYCFAAFKILFDRNLSDKLRVRLKEVGNLDRKQDLPQDAADCISHYDKYAIIFMKKSFEVKKEDKSMVNNYPSEMSMYKLNSNANVKNDSKTNIIIQKENFLE